MSNEPSQPKKRKSGNQSNVDSRGSKRPRFDHASKQREARTIATQTSFKAFKHGELDVDKFVKSREYEIQALERGLVNSKKALMKRAFQIVPKDLRRRTASHNVQRVPKRLRARARKEMKEDNTPTVTARKRKPNSHMRLRLETAKKLRSMSGARKKQSGNMNGKVQLNDAKSISATELEGVQLGDASSISADQIGGVQLKDAKSISTRIKSRPAKVKPPILASAPMEKAKFRKRQRDKTWLPTHLFHAKRARMTAASQPLWRFALPITPTAKSYRSVHRVTSDRGAMAWDTSYYSTIQLNGRRSSLNLLLKALGVEEQLIQLRKQSVRTWLLGNKALTLALHNRDQSTRIIAPANVFWSHKRNDEPDVAPEYQQCILWIRVHPAAFLELWEELLRVSKIVKPHVTVKDLRYEIGSIEIVGPEATDALLSILQPCSLPATQDDSTFFKKLSGITNTAVLDTGTLLSFDIEDPRLHHPFRTQDTSKKTQNHGALLEALAKRSNVRRSDVLHIMDPDKRTKACSKIPSQKALDRRRRAAPPGELPPRLEGDPSIPVLLFTSSNEKCKKPMSKWTVLLPWKWVQFVWYCLIYTPLPSGAQARFGGLDELNILALEYGIPTFPADYPASSAGWIHEQQARVQRHDAWHRRPKSKRVNWDTLSISSGRKGEVGLGWACDWTKLLKVDSRPAEASTEDTPTSAEEAFAALGLVQVSGTDANHLLQSTVVLPENLSNALLTVRIEALPRGVALVCARIYRLPASGALRKQWLQQHPALFPKQKSSQNKLPSLPCNAPAHDVRRDLARSLLTPTLPGQADYPDCPGEEDLIGFVTSGNYDLGAGKGVGIGNLSLRIVRDKWLAEMPSSAGGLDVRHLCVVRNSGQTIGRLARWELV